MDINGSNSNSRESQSSRGSENSNEGKKSTKKDIHDSVFINHAEIAWHERRRAWIGDTDRSQRSQRMPREPIMSWTTTYEDLLLSTEPFHQPIPLAEMVDFLVDNWHEEGLYD
uniref:Gag1-like clamp domain-containing protein n=1 Tax=Davidia involucrata TaxID=16924 RepID=A0A5B7CER6_DAVIN